MMLLINIYRQKSKHVRAASNPCLNNDFKNHMSTREYLHRKAFRSNDGHDWDEFKLYRTKVTTILYKTIGTFCNKNSVPRSPKSMLSKIVHWE